jgi:hypothetical protein
MNEIENLSDVLCDDQDLVIDNEWMEKLEVICKRRETVETLIEKAKQNQSDVKTAIYERVYQDYEQRLAVIEDDLRPVAKHIHLELTEIEAIESNIRSKLDLVEDELEEQTFRCKVGEFSEKELSEKVDTLADIKDRLSHQIEIATATYAGCTLYLGDSWRKTQLDVSQVEKEIAADTGMDKAGLVWADLGTTEAIEATDPATAEPAIEATPKLELAHDVKAVQEAPAKTVIDTPVYQPVSEEQTEVRSKLAACLQLINAKGEAETYEVGKEGLFIGKSTANDVVIKKAGISRRHARVAWLDDGEYTIQDLSGRGVGVNGELLEQATIKHGDTITVGKVELELIAQA